MERSPYESTAGAMNYSAAFFFPFGDISSENEKLKALEKHLDFIFSSNHKLWYALMGVLSGLAGLCVTCCQIYRQ